MSILVQLDPIEPDRHSCGHSATERSTIPRADPCEVCTGYANGYRKDSFWKWRKMFKLEDFTTCSEATRNLAEANRVASIRDTFGGELDFQTDMSRPGQRRLAARAKRVLRTDPNFTNPIFWIQTKRRRRDHLDILADLVVLDKKCWLLFVMDPGVGPEFLTSDPVRGALEYHRFTQAEVLALLAHKSADVRAYGLQIMGSPNRPKGRSR